MTDLPALSMVRDVKAAAALLDPTRLRLLRELSAPEGLSAAGLSRRVGMKRQLVNYHLRELEKAGVLEVVAEKRRGSATERIVRAAARSYVIDPAVMGDLAPDPARVDDRASASHLMATAARTIQEVMALRQGVGGTAQATATFSMLAQVRFGSAAERAAFFEDLASEVAKLISEYHDEAAVGGTEGGTSTLTIGSYPTITKAVGHDEEWKR